MIRRVDDREGMQWLGGEAHVRPNNTRPDRARLLRWLTSDVMALLAGTVLGSFARVGAMRAEGRKRYGQIDEQVVRVSNEGNEAMEPVRTDERQAGDANAGMIGSATVLAAFGLGLLAGAAVTLLTTPETGTSVRTRLRRGAETAKRELDGIAGETKESWDRVRNETGEAVTRTAIKIREAARVTKEALAEEGTSVPKAL